MQKNERLRKEYRLSLLSDNFKGVFGIMNRKDPSVMYIKLNAWCRYKDDIIYYSDNISTLNSLVKSEIKNKLRDSNLFSSMFFYTPEIKKTLLQNNVNFHTKFEISIKKKEGTTNDINIITKSIENLANSIINTIENFNEFEFKKSKF